MEKIFCDSFPQFTNLLRPTYDFSLLRRSIHNSFQPVSAHGKRSNNVVHRLTNAHRDGGLAAAMETDENAPASSRNHDRWILSRLITGRLTVPSSVSTAGKRSGNRWYEARKIIALPGNWDSQYDTTRTQLSRSGAQSIKSNNMTTRIFLLIVCIFSGTGIVISRTRRASRTGRRSRILLIQRESFLNPTQKPGNC